MTAAASVWAVSASTTASMRAGMRHNSDLRNIRVYKNDLMASVKSLATLPCKNPLTRPHLFLGCTVCTH